MCKNANMRAVSKMSHPSYCHSEFPLCCIKSSNSNCLLLVSSCCCLIRMAVLWHTMRYNILNMIKALHLRIVTCFSVRECVIISYHPHSQYKGLNTSLLSVSTKCVDLLQVGSLLSFQSLIHRKF